MNYPMWWIHLVIAMATSYGSLAHEDKTDYAHHGEQGLDLADPSLTIICIV